MDKSPAYLMDKRRKIDVAKALQMYNINGLTYREIAQYFGVKKQAVQQALKRFKDVLLSDGELQAYNDNKVRMLDSAEAKLMSDIVDPKRRKAASLNNVAYALTAVNNVSRLEKGLSTSNVAYVDLSASLDELQAQRAQLLEALDDL